MKGNHHGFFALQHLSSSCKRRAFSCGNNVRCAAYVLLVFAVATLAAIAPWSLTWTLAAAETLILGYLAAVVGLLALSSYVGDYPRTARRALIYWGWWPCWTLLICALAAVAGVVVGNVLWFRYMRQYHDVGALQGYRDIDPSMVPGTQIQDAGVVEFAMGTSIDAAHGGCFVNGGHNYCVAPILQGGRLADGLGNSPNSGSYDYFAVGVDCCSCPDNDFHCGDWLNPFARGGIRSTDAESRPFFKLAVDSWGSINRKSSEHPLFFEWVATPKLFWQNLLHRTIREGLLAVGTTALSAAVVSFMLGRVQQALELHGFASRTEPLAPPPGFESSWAKLLPDLLDHYQEEQLHLRIHSNIQEQGGFYGSAY